MTVTQKSNKLKDFLCRNLPDKEHLCMQLDYQIPQQQMLPVINENVIQKLIYLFKEMSFDISVPFMEGDAIRIKIKNHHINDMKISYFSVWCNISGTDNISNTVESYYQLLQKILLIINQGTEKIVSRIGARTNYDITFNTDSEKKQFLKEFVCWKNFLDLMIMRRIDLQNGFNGVLQIQPISNNVIRFDLDTATSPNTILSTDNIHDILLGICGYFERDQIINILCD